MEQLLQRLIEVSVNRSAVANFFYAVLGLFGWFICTFACITFVSYARERFKKRMWRKISLEEIIFFVIGICMILLAFAGTCLCVASVFIAMRSAM